MIGKILVSLFSCMLLWGCVWTQTEVSEKSSAGIAVPMVCIKDDCIVVEIADTPQERSQWLMHRTQLDTWKWMIFLFETSAKYSFRMKNTLIPLDMIWIDSSFKIVDIQTAQPCQTEPCKQYEPTEKAQFILEINWWEAQKLQWKIGDYVDFQNN